MKRVLKWAGYGLAGLLALVVIAVVGVFVASEAIIRWPVDKPAVTLVASSDPGAIARGKKVAVVQGCHNCHGERFEGLLFHDEPALVKGYAPNLSLAVAKQSDSDLDGAIRHGVAADGRRLWMMPSEAFAHLSDREIADLVAYMRTFKPTGAAQPGFQVGPVGRIGLLLGKFKSAPVMIAENGPGSRLTQAGPEHAQGRDLAKACVECHGQALGGNPGMGAPDLTMAASYDAADFERLLRTGVAAGDRRLGLMSQIAPARFNAWSSQEISALHGYLKARAQREIAAAETATLPKP